VYDVLSPESTPEPSGEKKQDTRAELEKLLSGIKRRRLDRLEVRETRIKNRMDRKTDRLKGKNDERLGRILKRNQNRLDKLGDRQDRILHSVDKNGKRLSWKDRVKLSQAGGRDFVNAPLRVERKPFRPADPTLTDRYKPKTTPTADTPDTLASRGLERGTTHTERVNFIVGQLDHINLQQLQQLAPIAPTLMPELATADKDNLRKAIPAMKEKLLANTLTREQVQNIYSRLKESPKEREAHLERLKKISTQIDKLDHQGVVKIALILDPTIPPKMLRKKDFVMENIVPWLKGANGGPLTDPNYFTFEQSKQALAALPNVVASYEKKPPATPVEAPATPEASSNPSTLTPEELFADTAAAA